MPLHINNQDIAIDNEGYLKEINDWSEPVATAIAQTENIVLTEEHWQVIHWLRDFYHEFGLTPIMRVVVKEYGKAYPQQSIDSAYFMKLFSGTPLKVATKIAGLPKPSHCF